VRATAVEADLSDELVKDVGDFREAELAVAIEIIPGE
jgi:hypothetical protein